MPSHALLSPSSATRWIACTPSARMEADRPDRAGEAADEGTLAHKLSELMLEYELKRLSAMGYKEKVKAVEKNKHYSDAMWEHCDQFKTYVMEQYAWAQTIDPGALIFLEHHISVTDYVPEGFGTGDVIIVFGEWVMIIDLKYGKGVRVEAKENKQMMLYALGTISEYGILYDIKKVRMTIYQPRIDNISYWDMDADALLVWAEEVLKPAAELAWEGKGDFKPGSHCTFCKVKTTCKANADFQMQLASHEFADPKELDEEELVEIFGKVGELVKWANSVKAYMYNESLLNGKKWPGLKLVEGKSPGRKITDPEKVIAALKKAKIGADMYLTKPVLFGITALDKNIGATEVVRLVGDWIIKQPGKPALVDESDNRAEYHSNGAAAKEFMDEDENMIE